MDKPNLEIRKGNLIAALPIMGRRDEGKPQIIVAHVVNDVGGWGAGFSGAIGDAIIGLERHYREKIRNAVLGDVIWFPDPPGPQNHATVLVANMVAQEGYSKRGCRALSYVALAHCMRRVQICSGRWRMGDKLYGPDIEIYAPKFGSGLGGGNWEFIKELICEAWIDAGIPVTIFDNSAPGGRVPDARPPERD